MTDTLVSDPTSNPPHLIFRVDQAGNRTWAGYLGLSPVWTPDSRIAFLTTNNPPRLLVGVMYPENGWGDGNGGPPEDLGNAIVTAIVLSQHPPSPPPPPPSPSPPPPPPTSVAWVNPEIVTIQGLPAGESAEDPWIAGGYLYWDSHGDVAASGPGGISYAKMVDYKTFDYVGRLAFTPNDPQGQAAPVVDDAGNIYFMTAEFSAQGMQYAQGVLGIGAKLGTVSGITKIVGVADVPHMSISPSRDGLLAIMSNNPDGGGSTIALAEQNADGSYSYLSNSAALLENVNGNSSGPKWGPSLSDDKLRAYWVDPQAAGGTNLTIWMAERSSPTGAFGPASPVPTQTADAKEGPCESEDGGHLYYHAVDPSTGRGSIWVLSRT